ncbi:MAG: TetR/AcrR family transcriptional regulator [Chitinophagaceae bacterium]|nr:TetR/AcrR family transcriptional regulator [Anaerolineae bacterium]
MTEDVHLRRVPRQTRGQQRVSKILSAAAELFAEIGYDAATTNAIAARAETSIGSLYQFFPNKDAILEALSNQYKAELAELFSSLSPNPNSSVELMFGQIVDTVAAFYASRPGFQVVFYGSSADDELAEAADVLYQTIIASIDGLIDFYMPGLEPTRRTLSALVSVKAVKSLLPMAVANNGTINPYLITEIKTLVSAYLRTTLHK